MVKSRDTLSMTVIRAETVKIDCLGNSYKKGRGCLVVLGHCNIHTYSIILNIYAVLRIGLPYDERAGFNYNVVSRTKIRG